GARRDECADARLVALLRGVGERRAFGAQSCPREAEHDENESTNSAARHVRLLKRSVPTRSVPTPFPLQSDGVEEIFDLSAAVAELLQMHADAIEQRQVDVGQRRSLPFVL